MQRVVESFCLFLLIGLVSLRPLVHETYDSAGSAFSVASDDLADPSPTRTLIFDMVILSCLGLCLLARAVGTPTRHRRTGLEWGLALVAVAAAISCWFAGNHRLAINATIDWLCGPLLAIALVQVLHLQWRRRLLLAAIIGSACVQAVLCYEQRLVGFDETWEHYLSIREQHWARQGVELDSSTVAQFEGRMKAREASGSFAHSSTAGSYLVLCAFAAFGAVVERWRRHRPGPSGQDWAVALACTLVAALIGSAAFLTQSRGALLAGLVGLLIWMVTRVCSTWVRAHGGQALIFGWLLVIGGAMAIVGYGVTRGRLPGVSLAFRWSYWQASSKLITDHALTGIGRENFGRHYPRYKPIESPEEISNPHNLFVQASADWGLPGLAGVLAMMLGASITVTGCRRRDSERDPPSTRKTPYDLEEQRAGCSASRRPSMMAWMVALVSLVVGGRLFLAGSTDPNYLYYTGVITGMAWLVGFAAFAFTDEGEGRENGHGPGGVVAAVAAGLFAFLLHDMIHFAIFVPATATTFFALVAYCVASRVEGKSKKDEVAPVSRMRRLAPVVAAAFSILLVGLAGLIPVVGMNSRLRVAQAQARALPTKPIAEHPGYLMFQAASRADPLDPTPQTQCARWLAATAMAVPELRVESWRLAAVSLDEAVRRDPHDVRLRRMQMQLYQARAAQDGVMEDHRAAIDAARSALELYPLDPKGLASLADCLLAAGTAGEAGRPRQYLNEAVKRYRQALDLDDARLEWETLRRFRARERNAIHGQMERAADLLQRLR